MYLNWLVWCISRVLWSILLVIHQQIWQITFIDIPPQRNVTSQRCTYITSDRLLQIWDLCLRQRSCTQKLWGAPNHIKCWFLHNAALSNFLFEYTFIMQRSSITRGKPCKCFLELEYWKHKCDERWLENHSCFNVYIICRESLYYC